MNHGKRAKKTNRQDEEKYDGLMFVDMTPNGELKIEEESGERIQTERSEDQSGEVDK